MKRGPKKTESILVPVWVPKVLVPYLDNAVTLEDSDRSKFIRNAVRDKIRKSGIHLPADHDAANAATAVKEGK